MIRILNRKEFNDVILAEDGFLRKMATHFFNTAELFVNSENHDVKEYNENVQPALDAEFFDNLNDDEKSYLFTYGIKTERVDFAKAMLESLSKKEKGTEEN